MSQRRMFNPEIVESDAFLEMPISTQALYFHLGMYADDDGFVSPKKIMRIINSGDDDLKVLKTKRFVLPFESGVVVIKHWLIHNLIRADLYKETLYKNEKAQLGLNDNGAYTELREGVSELKLIEAPDWLKKRRKEKLCTANVPQTALRLGKVRLGKDSKNTLLMGDEEFNSFWDKYPKKLAKADAKKVFQKIEKSKLPLILKAIESQKKTEQWLKDAGQFIPYPATWLNGQRWNDEIKTNSAEQSPAYKIWQPK